jgi:putative DNA primase/helicase
MTKHEPTNETPDREDRASADAHKVGGSQREGEYLANGADGQANFRIILEQGPPVKEPTLIQIRSGQIARIVKEVEEAILSRQLEVFQRAGRWVTPRLEVGKTASHLKREGELIEGSDVFVTRLVALSPPALHLLLNANNVHFYKIVIKRAKKGEPPPKPEAVEINPPPYVLDTLLASRTSEVNKVTGVVNCPTLRPDGSLLVEQGYDEATGVWAQWEDSLVLPAIPEHPTKDDALTALQLYKDLLRGFPLKTELDKAVAVAAILTAVLRVMLGVAPMTLFVAPTQGTGKSYLADVIANIINGRDCPVITAGSSREENEKRIGAVLLEGPPIISIDNLSHDLEGDLLCQMCTQRTVKIRILGKSETPDCEWRGTLLATGNNVGLVGDMVRRGLTANMDAEEAEPFRRVFDFDPVELVRKDRGKYVAAALTMALARRGSRYRAECKPLAGYDTWSYIVRDTLVWLGMKDVVVASEEALASDPKRLAATELMEQWLEHLGTTKAYKTAEIIASAKESNPPTWTSGPQLVRPEFYNALVELAGVRGVIEAANLGRRLGKLVNQVHSLADGKSYRITVPQKTEGHGHSWQLLELAPKAG